MKFFNIFTSLVAATTTMVTAVSSVAINSKEVGQSNQIFQDSKLVNDQLERSIQQTLFEKENSDEDNFSDFRIEEIEDDEFDTATFLQDLLIKAEYEIKELFTTVAKSDSIYYELFVPEKGELVKFKPNSNKNSTNYKEILIFDQNKNDIFWDRQIFRLNQLVKAKVQPKFQFDNFKAFDFHLEDLRAFSFSPSQDQYTIAFKVKLIRNDNILVKEWTENFKWEAKKVDHHIRHNANNLFIREAENFCLNVNKKMFSHNEIFNDDRIFLNYMNSQITTISPDFSIVLKENITVPLKAKNVEGSVYLKDKQVFNFILTESSSHVSFVNSHKNKTKIHKVRKNHKLATEFKYSIDNLLEQTSLKYNDLLAKFDPIGLIVKASEDMKHHLYPYEFAKQIHITTNLEENKQLASVIRGNSKLNFTWIVVSPCGIFTYDNSQLQLIKYHDRTWDLQVAINANLFDPKKNDFLLTRRDMVRFLNSKLKTAGAALFIKDSLDLLPLKDYKFHVEVFQRFYDDNDQYHENRVGVISYNPVFKSRKLFFLYFRRDEVLETFE